MKKEILIIGAGISGLSSGILLLEAGYKVRVWAREFSPDTTSDVAAGVWYPYLCNPKDKVSSWSKFTLDYIRKNLLDKSEAGCIQRTVTEMFPQKVEEPWWGDVIKDYRRPKAEELPDGYVDGYEVDAVLMDSTKYMKWLMDEYQKLGGKLEKKTIEKIEEATDACEIVVNCTGLGSRDLFDDKRLFPVRGQVICVPANGFEKVMADDTREGPNNLMVIIPRINDIVLGGTAQENNWDTTISEQDTKEILAKARSLYPEFKDSVVIKEKAGLRPVRDEVRLEVEEIGGRFVVHNYGHGGAGYTLSWGCANDVVELVNQLNQA